LSLIASQAYIERNFAPPLLFRDIRELGNDAATTAYGAKRPVPGEVDVLIAGTSCVDYSNLNTKQKGIEQKGESGQTFWGMLGWVRRHRPPIVIQENVCSAPWEKMTEYYAKYGYAATFLRVDTKNHYVPHTRTRVYLLAIDMTAPNRFKAALARGPAAKPKEAITKPKVHEADEEADEEAGTGGGEEGNSAAPLAPKPTRARCNELPRWKASIDEMARPSSSSLEAFLLPSDDPRVHRARMELSKPKNDQRKVVDWGRCITRHERARTQECLGNKRPLTRWVSQGHATLPDFAWHDWGSAQVRCAATRDHASLMISDGL
jgi:site-specific DNA-cytosine methylase